MDKVKKVTKYISEIQEAKISIKQIKKNRNKIIDIVFSYGEGHIFDSLVNWDNIFYTYVKNLEQGLNIPDNRGDVSDVIGLVRSLDSKSSQ